MSTPSHNTEEWFQELLQRNRRRIGAIARTYGGRQCDDLLQEILLQIWRSLPKLCEETHADTWCYRVALNTAISWTRSASRRQPISASSTETSQEAEQVAGAVDGYDPFELLQRFLQSLPETDRAIVLMYLDDLS